MQSRKVLLLLVAAERNRRNLKQEISRDVSRRRIILSADLFSSGLRL
jgi:hypothetical protein